MTKMTMELYEYKFGDRYMDKYGIRLEFDEISGVVRSCGTGFESEYLEEIQSYCYGVVDGYDVGKDCII